MSRSADSSSADSSPEATKNRLPVKRRAAHSSLRMVAEESGLSINAVSDILNRNRSKLYRPETVEKVMQAAQKLQYRPNRAAKILLTNRSYTIAFVTTLFGMYGELENFVVYPFLIGANHSLGKGSYHLTLLGMQELREAGAGKTTLPHLLQEQFFDGVILQKGRWGDIRDWLQTTVFPVIQWDSGVFTETGCVFRDEYEVGRTIALRLLELGHRKIAFHWDPREWELFQTKCNPVAVGDAVRAGRLDSLDLSDDAVHFSSILRFEACRYTFAEAGCNLHVVTTAAPSELAAQLLRVDVTAIVLGTAFGLPMFERACALIGKRVPHDVTIVSCDVDPGVRPEPFTPQLGGVTYDRFATGQIVGELMLKAVTEQQPHPASIRLLGDFILGDTVAAARA